MNKGDMIEVSDNGEHFVIREFVTMVGDQYLCNVPEENTLFLWKHSRGLPWIDLGDEFPNARPSDEIEYKLRAGGVFHDIAASLYWGHTGGGSDIVAWRKV